MKAEEQRERTKEDIVEQISQRAKVYVPEWKFDPENPDAGTALALLFADMFAGTVNRFRRIPQKLERDFLRQLGIERMPAVPAEGYVTFGLSSNEFGGALLEKGTVVMGPDNGGGSGEAAYETTETIYVTPAELSQLIFMDGKQDHIEKKNPCGPFSPFSSEKENLCEHILYLCQNEVLSFTGEAELRLKLAPCGAGGRRQAEEWLAEPEEISIAYGTKDGFFEFSARGIEGDSLILQKSKEQPDPEMCLHFEREGCWICCRVKKPWKREAFFVRDIRLFAKREGIEPDFIQNGEGEQKNERIFPFGEQPALFGECYIASKEALGKAEALVRVTFSVEYERVPLDYGIAAERNWKPIMKRSDFGPDPEYDITIEQVVWEYYNGSGFRRLPVAPESETMFNGAGGACSQKELVFLCPKDAGLLEWQCAPTRYIRVRVLRMNNLYQIKGTYVTPMIRDIRFHYAYTGEGRPPEFAAAVNRMEQTVFPVGDLNRGPVCWEVFSGLKSKAKSLYLGFNRPPAEGPVKLFCAAAKRTARERAEIVYEYYKKGGFAPLTVFDETEGLRQNGFLTLAGEADFAPLTVCGETAYWVRLTEKTEAGTDGTSSYDRPMVQGLFLNTARIRARENGPGSGAGGNQPSGAINRLGSSAGYVKHVANRMPVCGGCDRESVSEAIRRGRMAIRHRNRAVTAGDYEALACEASRYVQKVRCYPGYNLYGEYEPGSITLVVLQKEFEQGQIYFPRIRERIYHYLCERMDQAASGRLYITEPVFLEINCYAGIVVSDLEHSYEIQERVKEELKTFIHPVTGNYHGKGFPIGVCPNEVQIANAIKTLPGIRFVRELKTTVTRRAGQEGRGFGPDHTCSMRYAAALSGVHTVAAKTEW